ncbi:MAG: hypothetical protein K2J32_04785 [Ruminococcus sp.]|nr:hypothetical protein [Ruminococcus sp.]
MNDDNTLISDYLNKLKRESNMDEPEITLPETNPNTNDTDSAVQITSNTDTFDNKETYQAQNDVSYDNYVAENNTNFSILQNFNSYSYLSRCYNKYVQIPNCPVNVYTYFDSNYNAYLCTTGINGQPLLFANILFEGFEFVVYQNYQRVGTLYGNDNEQVWRFIPNSMPVPNQNPQCIQSSTLNTPTYNYVFNNVPNKQANEIIDSIIRSQPTNNVTINFASSSTNTSPVTEDHIDVINIPPENYSTN